MVEPQGDPILKFIGYLNYANDQLSRLDTSKTLMTDRAANLAQKVQKFSQEINKELNEIKERVEIIRRKVAENLGSP